MRETPLLCEHVQILKQETWLISIELAKAKKPWLG